MKVEKLCMFDLKEGIPLSKREIAECTFDEQEGGGRF